MAIDADLGAGCIDEAQARPRRELVGRLPMLGIKPLKPERAELVGRYALQIYWNDGHSTGIYSFDYLRNLCSCPQCELARQISRTSRRVGAVREPPLRKNVVPSRKGLNTDIEELEGAYGMACFEGAGLSLYRSPAPLLVSSETETPPSRGLLSVANKRQSNAGTVN